LTRKNTKIKDRRNKMRDIIFRGKDIKCEDLPFFGGILIPLVE